MKPASLQMQLDRAAAEAQSKIANEHFQTAHAEYHTLLSEREELQRQLAALIEKSQDNTVRINASHKNLTAAKAVCDEVHARLTALPVLPAKAKTDAVQDAAHIAIGSTAASPNGTVSGRFPARNGDVQANEPRRGVDETIRATGEALGSIPASKITNPLT